MKYNQYAYLSCSLQTQIKELKAIHFLPEAWSEISFSQLLARFVGEICAEAKTDEAKKAKLATFAVSDHENLTDFLRNKPETLTVQEFANVAWQLLGYHPYGDYTLSHPEDLSKHQQLPLPEKPINSREALISAFYRLLNTRAKNGQLLLDTMAANGYFNPFFGQNKFLFFNGKSLPVFDTQKIIREVVYVESDLDTDEDGQNDLLQVSIMRPQESDHGLKVPALYTADPYFGGIIDNVKRNHDVDENLTDAVQDDHPDQKVFPHHPAAKPSQEDHPATESAVESSPYSLNEYLLARGFANVYAGGIGTRGSDGIRICGAPEETICAREIIEWLHGDRVAYTDRSRKTQTKASWCNQSIGMTGRSYLGTLQIAVATTGVAGLKTVVSEAAISSWYDYYREHGLVIAPEACQGEDTDLLSETCQSNLWDGGDYLKRKPAYEQNQKELLKNEDRVTGQYSSFWETRNYRHHTDGIKCSFISVHGLNDWNVKPKNVYKLWQKLDTLPIPHKLFLHQGPHYNMNNLVSIDFTDLMNLWFCHELLQLDNHAPEQWPTVMIQDNLKADCWHAEKTWNTALGQKRNYQLNSAGELTSTDPGEGQKEFLDFGGKKFKSAAISEAEWQNEFLKGKANWLDSQLRFISEPFSHPITIVGRPKIKLRVKASLPKGQLSVALIELGKRRRLTPIPRTLMARSQKLGYRFGYEDLKEFVPDKMNEFKLITKGHMNLQNYADMKKARTINADEFYELSFFLQPTYYQIPAETKLGLILYSTDQGMTKRPLEEEKYTFDLSDCQLTFYQK